MLKGYLKYIKELIPHPVKKDISFNTKNILEILFLYITGICSKKSNLKSVCTEELIIENFVSDLLRVTIVIGTISLFTQILIALLFAESPIKEEFVAQILVIILFISIVWTGLVYLINNFRRLVKTKILSNLTINNCSEESDYYTLLILFFNGICLKWQSGKEFHIHIRTVLCLIIMMSAIFIVFLNQGIALFSKLLVLPNFELLLGLIILLSTFILIEFFLLVVFYAIFTVGFIIFYLFKIVINLKIKINPLLNRGGLENYVKILIDGITLLSLSLAALPLIPFVSSSEFINKINAIQLGNQTFSDLFSRFGNAVLNFFKELSFDSLLYYSGIIVLLLGCIIISIFIIIILHYQIKQSKSELMQQIENKIENTDFLQMKDQSGYERDQHILFIYEKISKSSEWPVKGKFVLEIILVFLPILVSYIL